jgi:hypothetical protein
MAPVPGDRFASAGDLAKALDAVTMARPAARARRPVPASLLMLLLGVRSDPNFGTLRADPDFQRLAGSS